MTWTDDLTSENRAKIDTALDQRGAQHLDYANNDRDFAAFLLVADSLAHRRYGVSIYDLPDYCWRDVYEDGLTPRQALNAAQENGI
jgi:hypothetical protein